MEREPDNRMRLYTVEPFDLADCIERRQRDNPNIITIEAKSNNPDLGSGEKNHTLAIVSGPKTEPFPGPAVKGGSICA